MCNRLRILSVWDIGAGELCIMRSGLGQRVISDTNEKIRSFTDKTAPVV